VPVMRATRQVREQFRNMQDQANGGGGAPGQGFKPGSGFQQSSGFKQHSDFKQHSGFRPGAGAGHQPGADGKRSSAKPPAEDYIDFEEIK
jgi:hypothetical protein